MGWMFMSPQNSYTATLMPMWYYKEVEPLGGHLESEVLVNRTSALIRRGQRAS